MAGAYWRGDSDREQLTRSPEDVSDLLRMMVFSATHPVINEHLPLRPAEIVSVVLDGVRRREGGPNPC